MGRQLWKPGNMLYPVPAVMVTCKKRRRKTKYNYNCMGRNRMQFTGNGFDFS